MICVLCDLPPYSSFGNENAARYMGAVFEVFHQTAYDTDYASRGEQRSKENHCIFHYTLSGCGEVIYGGKAHRVVAGEGFFNVINAGGCGYGYPRGEKEPWEFIVICFEGVGVREAVERLCNEKVVYGLDTEDFLKMCGELFYSKESRITFLSRLILKLFTDGAEESLVRKFRREVNLSALENPTVSSIATCIGVSREHLSRVYFEESGETPAAYIKHRRYEMLCEMLASGRSFDETARLMHFPSVQGMSLFFKKMIGMSPSEYVKRGYLKI